MKALEAAPKLVAIALAVCMLPAGTALAGGFDIPGVGARSMGRGSAYIVLADDLSALLLNPGGLSRQKGTSLLLGENLLWHHGSFTRQPSVLNDPQPNTRPADPLATVENEDPLFPLGMAFGLASDFGLEDWVFALQISGPNAVGHVKYPTMGGQRYMFTEMDMLLIYYSAAAAWGKKDHFGIGLTLTYVQLPKSQFSMLIDGVNGPGQPLHPYYSDFDLIANLDLADHTSFTATLGAWWRVVPQLELGVSARVVPIYLNPSGDVTMDTPSGQDSPMNISGGGGASMDLTLPIIVRAGLRYRHLDKRDREVFDIELDFVYEAWSSVDEYKTKLADTTVDYGSGPVPTIDDAILLPRKWKDTFSVRLGGSWNAVPDLFTWSLGGFWESAAVPNNYSYIDVASFDRFGAGTGLSFRFYGVDLNIAYMHVFQLDREVDEQYAKVFQSRPLSPCAPTGYYCGGVDGVPVNAGKYETSYDQLNMSLTLHFDQWF